MPAKLISVDEAKAFILNNISALDTQTIALDKALGRIIASDICARLSHPAHPISAMDGYALHLPQDRMEAGTQLKIIGESAAGHPFSGQVNEGEAVRIFTGGYLPDGCNAILIQEDAKAEGTQLWLNEAVTAGQFVRPAGLDFNAGDLLVPAQSMLKARSFALAALSGTTECVVRRKPKIAILSSGDELVPFGEMPGKGQLINSNSLYLKTLVEAVGGEAYDLGILPDKSGALLSRLGEAIAHTGGFDLILCSGGASVGTHDHIHHDLNTGNNVELNFWKIAMRPGKPLMFAHVQDIPFIGLPGNPVSAGVCALVFVIPAIHKCLGLDTDQPAETAILTQTLKENDRRQDYLRAQITTDASGRRMVTAMVKQDSSMLSHFSIADALIIRPPHAPEAQAGDEVPILSLPQML